MGYSSHVHFTRSWTCGRVPGGGGCWWASWGSISRVHTTGVHPQCTCGGILRGTGNQKAGAIINAVGYYVLGLPIGISLMFAAGLGLLGKPPPRAGRAGITAWEVAVRARRQILRRGFKRRETGDCPALISKIILGRTSALIRDYIKT